MYSAFIKSLASNGTAFHEEKQFETLEEAKDWAKTFLKKVLVVREVRIFKLFNVTKSSLVINSEDCVELADTQSSVGFHDD